MATTSLQTMTSSTGLPSGWEIRMSRSHNIPYYFDSATHESSWEPPVGTDADELKVYMAANFSFVMPASITIAASGPQSQSKIRCSHLLIKHAGSRRPSSWKEKHITRTEDEARQILEGLEAKIKAGKATLGELAVSESDDSSARKGGDLGFFGRGEMQKEFEEAAFALNVGQMSRIIKTGSGLHLIERTA
ncbi:hypothetical protein V1512DRAFT_234187 [Lipomyces arxii]|uniref:uncharacterized protein n=1 Tax=Lipomyces arxii TaxID=56418 RepID=UPI0034CF4E6E